MGAVIAWGLFGPRALAFQTEGVIYNPTRDQKNPNGSFELLDPRFPLLFLTIPAGPIFRVSPDAISKVVFNQDKDNPAFIVTFSDGTVVTVPAPLPSSAPAESPATLAPQAAQPSVTSVAVSNDADTFALTPDAHYAVVVGFPSGQSPVSLVDEVAGKEIQTLDYPNQTSDAAAIGDDGTTVLVATGAIGVFPNPTNTNTIRLLTLGNGVLTDSGQTLVLGDNAYIAKIAIAPGSQSGVALVLTSGSGVTSQLVSFTLPGLAQVATVTLARPSGDGLAIAPSGGEVFAQSGDAAAHPDVIERFDFDPTTGAFSSDTASLTITPISGFTGSLLQDPLAIAADGSELLVIEQNVNGILSGPRVSGWDPSTGEFLGATAVSAANTIAPAMLDAPNGAAEKATVKLSGLAATYDASSHAVTVTTNPAGLSASVTYNGSATAPVNAGSYSVVATINETGISGSAKGTLVIRKATAQVMLGDLDATYDGGSHAATAATTPAGLAVSFTYNGNAAPPVNAGSYQVVGAVNDPNYTGKATGTLTIAKAAATVTLTPASLTATYTGKKIAAEAATIPPDLPVTFAYQLNGEKATPVNAGSYSLTATVDTANASGSTTGTLTINPKPVTVAFGNLTAVFTGAPIAATATTSPVKVPVSFAYQGTSTSRTPPTAVGSYAVTAFLKSSNYTISGNAPGMLTIEQPVHFALEPATPLLSAAGAQVSFGVNPGGISTQAYFVYSTDPGFASPSQTPSRNIGSGKQQLAIGGFFDELEPKTTYYYKLVTTSAAGVFAGPVESFTTLGFDTALVAATGDPAPNTTFSFATLGNAAVEMNDGVAFRATLTGASPANNTGIWANQDDSGTLKLVAQTGSAAPDESGNPSGAVFAALSDPVYNNQEDVAFSGALKVTPGLVTSATANGVWASSGGTLSLLAREGGAAPGTGGATFAAFHLVSLSDDAGAILAATLAISPTAGVTATNDAGVWEGATAQSLTLMLRAGETTDTGKTIAAFKFLPLESGVIGQTRGFGPTTGHLAALATYADKSTGIVRVSAPVTPIAVATSGDAAAETMAAIFATFSSPAINDLDHVAFAATLKTGIGDASKANAGGIWAGYGTNSPQLVARLGETAPGTTAAFTAFSDPVYNANDAVAFRAALSVGVGLAGVAADTGICCNSTGPLELVAQSGGQAPGCAAGVTFSAFNELALDDVNGATRRGGVIFLAALRGAGVTSANDTGIFAVDRTGQLQLIVRTGAVLGSKTVVSLSFLPVETAGNAKVSGQGRSFSPSTGDLVYNAAFSDRSQAILSVVFPTH